MEYLRERSIKLLTKNPSFNHLTHYLALTTENAQQIILNLALIQLEIRYVWGNKGLPKSNWPAWPPETFTFCNLPLPTPRGGRCQPGPLLSDNNSDVLVIVNMLRNPFAMCRWYTITRMQKVITQSYVSNHQIKTNCL